MFAISSTPIHVHGTVVNTRPSVTYYTVSDDIHDRRAIYSLLLEYTPLEITSPTGIVFDKYVETSSVQVLVVPELAVDDVLDRLCAQEPVTVEGLVCGNGRGSMNAIYATDLDFGD